MDSTRSAVPVVGAFLLCASLTGCCCPRAAKTGPAHSAPLPEELILNAPPTIPMAADTITEMSMRNVYFHVDDDILLRVRHMRGRIQDLAGKHLIVLDDKKRLELQMAFAEIALTADDLTTLLNRYVFGYPGSPLKQLVVKTSGKHIVQTGIMHKVIDIPFRMTAELSVTPDHKIRIHPIALEICGLNGFGLMRAVGTNLSKMMDLSGAKGATVQGNDILLDPLVILPPPKIEGEITSVYVEGDEIVQIFGDASSPGAAPLPPPVPAMNYIYFRGGVIRFGKLFMVQSDLEAVDADQSDPFNFYLDYYHTQLVAGYHTTLPNYALYAVLPDFNDLGTLKGRATPPNGLMRPGG
jgi:hypothetical protein